MKTCIVTLISLDNGVSLKGIVDQVERAGGLLIRGVPHGWIHSPHHLDKDNLLGHLWDLFTLTEDQIHFEQIAGAAASVAVSVSLTDEHYQAIRLAAGAVPKPNPNTAMLPTSWLSNGSTEPPSQRSITVPDQSLVAQERSELAPGELRLDQSMSTFLSTALPSSVRDAPVSLFNLFKYKNDDRSVHDSYMNGFKRNFGDTAGAQVKFMGPCEDPKARKAEQEGVIDLSNWDDANLVQYDSIWHYAYMLSTGIYKELNKEKVAGLYDTCILLVSEIEMF